MSEQKKPIEYIFSPLKSGACNGGVNSRGEQIGGGDRASAGWGVAVRGFQTTKHLPPTVTVISYLPSSSGDLNTYEDDNSKGQSVVRIPLENNNIDGRFPENSPR